LLGGGNPGVDLAGCVECNDARAVELERLALLRRPLRDGLVELRINDGSALVLRCDEDVAELREECQGSLGRIVTDAERALHIERRARKPLGFPVTALLDQDAGEPDDEFRASRDCICLAP
jgi:hypothetical protein